MYIGLFCRKRPTKIRPPMDLRYFECMFGSLCVCVSCWSVRRAHCGEYRALLSVYRALWSVCSAD